MNDQAVEPESAKKREPKKRHHKPKGKGRPQADQPLFDVSLLETMSPQTDYNAVHSARVEALNGQVTVKITLASGQILAHVPKEEFGSALPSVGDVISVYLSDPIKAQPDAAEALPFASWLKAKSLGEWEALLAAQKANQDVFGMLVGQIKGGYSVALFASSQEEADLGHGIRAFLPQSQSSLSAREHLSVYTHEPMQFQILEISKGSGGVIVSRRDLLRAERQRHKQMFWESAQLGDEVVGTVRHLVAYGAFVDVQGAEGLLHASDLVWHRQPSVAEVLRVGDQLQLKIIELNKEKRRLKLGLKQLMPDPWSSIADRFRTGMEVDGTVVALADFGAFVQLADGIEGLVHLSEISWQRVKHPSSKFRIGDAVRARVLSLDQAHHRISLSTKAMEANPIERVAEKFPPGTVVRTHVSSLRDFGAFVELDPQVQGLVHIGEMSWTKHLEHPSELLSEGQELEVVVLGFDLDRQRVSCSIKRLTDDPWQEWRKKYAKGTRHSAVIKRLTPKGAECELEADLTAFCPQKELQLEMGDKSEPIRVGQRLDVEVTAIEPSHQKVLVSAKTRQEHEIREDYAHYMKKQEQDGKAKMTMADLLKDSRK